MSQRCHWCGAMNDLLGVKIGEIETLQELGRLCPILLFIVRALWVEEEVVPHWDVHTNVFGIRGWAEQEPSICAGTGYPVPVFQIPVPAEPVPDIWQEKSRNICNSLNWFQRVTFTFQIKIYRNKIFLLIFLPVATGTPVIPVGQRQKQDIPYSHKYLVSFPLNPYIGVGCNLSSNWIESCQSNIFGNWPIFTFH